MKNISAIRILCLIILGLISHSAELRAQLVLNQSNTTGVYTDPVSITMVPGFGTNGAFHAYIASSGPGPGPVAPFGNQNYIVSTAYRTGVQAPVAAVTAQQATRTIVYYDGLGRAMQGVQWQGSPLKRDVVTHKVYDQYGAESRKFLPYAEVSEDNGQYKSAAASRQLSYYSTANAANAGVVRTPNPYADAVYEKSPLMREESSGFAGTAWQVSTNRTIKQDRGTNAANSVKRWQISGTNATGTAFYPAGSLRRTTVYDENNTDKSRPGSVEEYIDYEGRTVLKRVWESATKSLDTYYIYDLLGRLRYVVPPSVTATAFAEDDATFSAHIYGYRYDTKGRVVEKKIPGKTGWDYIVYNRLDEVVLTQDPVQRTRKEWSYTRYDGRGRIASSGLYINTNNNQQTRASIQSLVDAHTGPLWESRNRNAAYANVTFPTAATGVTLKELAVSYYDDHMFTGASTLAANVSVSVLTHGLPTGGITYNEDGTSGRLSTSYYDDYARVVQSVSENHLGGVDRITNTYNFPGELLTSTRQHRVSGSTAVTTVLTTNSYDHVGRLTETRKKVNSQAEVIQSRLAYNEIGQLTEKKLHSENGGTNFINTIAYTYNERGWMNKLSSPHFTQEMRYTDPVSGGTAQYNGNIAQLRWGHAATVSETSNYGYDKLNRLLSGVKTGTVMSEVLEYDDMGNITNLKRDGHATGINYTYTGNRLTSLNGALQGDYTYDLNGNATKDRTGMNFAYNHLNLPDSVWNSGGTVKVGYLYDALGTKLRKIATAGGTTTWRDYVGGIEYSKVGSAARAIEMIHTEEGYLQRNASNNTYTYHYNLTDHLGNVRATLQRTGPATGSVIQKHDYYPFGKAKALVTSGINKYLYNGKEIQDEVGGQYDYGARFYDAEIGRFTGVDPIAEKFPHVSVYNYAENEPVVSIDLWGLQRWMVNGRERTTAMPGWRTDARAAAFAVRHPVAASRIGTVVPGSTNISSVAGRYARHFAEDTRTSKDPGTLSNAFRHVLWSAMVRNEFDGTITKRATNAHEGVGIGESQYVDMSAPFRGGDDIELADHIVDVLNNDIGIRLSESMPNSSAKDLATMALYQFMSEGLWTTQKDKDGNLKIEKQKLDSSLYIQALKSLGSLDQNGFSEEERRRLEEERRRQLEALKDIGQNL